MKTIGGSSRDEPPRAEGGEGGPERVWLLSRHHVPGGPDEPRRAIEGVALSAEDAALWLSEGGEYDHQAEVVPVWRPALMTVGPEVDLDDPEIAEAMEDIRQAAGKRLRKGGEGPRLPEAVAWRWTTRDEGRDLAGATLSPPPPTHQHDDGSMKYTALLPAPETEAAWAALEGELAQAREEVAALSWDLAQARAERDEVTKRLADAVELAAEGRERRDMGVGRG